MMWSHFHFLRPAWLWLLLPLVGLLLLIVFSKRRHSSWEPVCDAHLLPHLLVVSEHHHKSWPFFLLAIAWLSAVLALAGPAWSLLPQMVYQAQNSVVLGIDTSASMDAADLLPSRLERAKFKTLDMLKRLQGSRVGMLAFTSEPFVIAPLTQDTNTIALLVPSVQTQNMPVQGINLARALESAAALLKQGKSSAGEIIFITDSKPDEAALQMARDLAKNGTRISILGIGTERGAPIRGAQGGFLTNAEGKLYLPTLDRDSLRALARAGNGNYVDFTDNDADVSSVLQNALHVNDKAAELSHESIAMWQDQGRWFLLPALFALLLAFRRGWLEEVLR